MSRSHTSAFSLAVAVMLISPIASSGNAIKVANSKSLPEIACDKTKCWVVPENMRYGASTTPLAATPDTSPFVIAPPAGQRLLWRGAGYPSCQSVSGVTASAPYEYMKSGEIPVPLGSTHISLSVTFESKQIVTSGSAGNFGRLQVRRWPSGLWDNVSHGYASTALADLATTYQFGAATYIGLVDLANLTGDVGTVPSAIEVRMAVFETMADNTVVVANQVCKGLMEVSF